MNKKNDLDRKTEWIKIRVTKKEKFQLECRAKVVSNGNVSGYIRRRVFKKD
jgi:hypothetical protein